MQCGRVRRRRTTRFLGFHQRRRQHVGDADHQAQDARDAATLYHLIEDEIVPEFYAGDGAWVGRMRASLKTLAPMFSATRMLADYERKMYASGVRA